jgi:hypothetical protein
MTQKLADDGLNGPGQPEIHDRQKNGYEHNNDQNDQGRHIGFLPRRPMDLPYFLPGILKKLDRAPNSIRNILYPFSHENAERDEMAGQAGLEPATTGFGVRRSSQLELLTLLSSTVSPLCVEYEPGKKDRIF